MLPLGGCWSGVCRAAPELPLEPDEALLRPVCNMGYARGRCVRFPARSGPDAVRFTVRADDGSSVRIYYVVERDHHPFAHGPLEYSRALGSLVEPPPDGNLGRQAQAYVNSYLRRKTESSAEQP